MTFQFFVSFQVLVPQNNINLVPMLVLALLVKVFSLLRLWLLKAHERYLKNGVSKNVVRVI